MRVLYLSQYFPPEIGATQIRAYEMTQGLLKAGHQVTVITEFPNHPAGIIPPQYKGKLYERSAEQGVDVIRVWVKASPVKTFASRMAFYLSYMLMALFAGLFLARGKYDVIYVTSPPLFVGITALILKFLRRTPFVFEVRDLWPESAVTLGELNNPRFIGWATKLEELCYGNAWRIVVTAQEIVDRLLERGLPPEKVVLIRNGANTTLFKQDRAAGESLRAELGLQDKFIVLYAGLHGLAYDLEGMLQVAQSLQSEPEIHFLFVGDGPTKVSVLAKAEELAVENVTFLPLQPPEAIPAYFNAANVSVVPMKSAHVVGTLPIKIYDSMACQTPVIVSASGEVRAVLEECNGGITVPPGDYPAIKAAILRLRANPQLCAQFGEAGRAAVVAKFSRQAQAQQLVAMLATLQASD